MKEKIILENYTELSIDVAMELFTRIIKKGKISNNGKQYCYLTSIVIDEVEYHIVSSLNKCSHKLMLYTNPNTTQQP